MAAVGFVRNETSYRMVRPQKRFRSYTREKQFEKLLASEEITDVSLLLHEKSHLCKGYH